MTLREAMAIEPAWPSNPPAPAPEPRYATTENALDHMKKRAARLRIEVDRGAAAAMELGPLERMIASVERVESR